MKESEDKNKKLEEKINLLSEKILKEKNVIKRYKYIINVEILKATFNRNIEIENAKEKFNSEKEEKHLVVRKNRFNIFAKISDFINGTVNGMKDFIAERIAYKKIHDKASQTKEEKYKAFDDEERRIWEEFQAKMAELEEKRNKFDEFINQKEKEAQASVREKTADKLNFSTNNKGEKNSVLESESNELKNKENPNENDVEVMTRIDEQYEQMKEMMRGKNTYPNLDIDSLCKEELWDQAHRYNNSLEVKKSEKPIDAEYTEVGDDREGL